MRDGEGLVTREASCPGMQGYPTVLSISRAHEWYVSQQRGVEWYQGEMTGVTAHFQSLSQEVMACIGELRRRGMGCVATILENIQEKEKEKLQLVSMWMLCHCSSQCGPRPF